jgi:hypothetical protein
VPMEMAPPHLSMADITIALPSLDKLRKLTDRLRHLSTETGDMTVGANLAGDFELGVKSNNLDVKTQFHDKEQLESHTNIERNRDFTKILVSIADFNLALSMGAMRPSGIECRMVRNFGLMIQGYIQNDNHTIVMSVSFYLPKKESY